MKKNDAGAKNQEAFAGILGALKAVYEAEIERLTELYRPRILAGEFSGCTPPGPRPWLGDDPRYLALERELEKTHPWVTASEQSRLAVVACSRWVTMAHKAATNPKTGEELDMGWGADFADTLAAECMMQDILNAAAERGWVKRLRFLNEHNLFALKVA